MSEPFLAEIRIVGFNFAPRGWALCDGQILPINQNQSLYSLLGTTYGGDGRTSFALPDLRGRTPLHRTTSSTPGIGDHKLGQRGGEETHTLSVGEMPQHTHGARAANLEAVTTDPGGSVLANAPGMYGPASTTIMMRPNNLTTSGNNNAHDNMQPSLAVNFCIALQGLFPSRN